MDMTTTMSASLRKTLQGTSTREGVFVSSSLEPGGKTSHRSFGNPQANRIPASGHLWSSQAYPARPRTSCVSAGWKSYRRRNHSAGCAQRIYACRLLKQRETETWKAGEAIPQSSPDFILSQVGGRRIARSRRPELPFLLPELLHRRLREPQYLKNRQSAKTPSGCGDTNRQPRDQRELRNTRLRVSAATRSDDKRV